MVVSLNLSLSTVCSADCVFCPSGKGKNCNNKLMSLETAKRLIDDAVEIESLKFITFSENGDCFFNKNIIDILRYAKEKLPKVQRIIYTNFRNLQVEISEIIIKEHLVNNLYCNIDSIDPTIYSNIKRLSFDKVWYNFILFLKIRDFYSGSVSLNVNIVNMKDYEKICRNLFGKRPSKFIDNKVYYSDPRHIVSILNPLLDAVKDNISMFEPVLWAERKDNEGFKHSNFKGCPRLECLKDEIFFNPDGKSYLCCYDHEFNLIVGDIHEESLKDIINGKTRKEYFKKLENGELDSIGFPCNTNVCCFQIAEEEK